MHKRICGGRNWKQSSYLQSQRFPSHVLEQSRGGGERALRAFLQRQGDACRVPTQQIHQVLQLPAHLENNNSMMGVSSAHRQPRDSDDRNNKLTFKCEHPDSDWIGDSTFIPFTHDLDSLYDDDYRRCCCGHYFNKTRGSWWLQNSLWGSCWWGF